MINHILTIIYDILNLRTLKRIHIDGLSFPAHTNDEKTETFENRFRKRRHLTANTDYSKTMRLHIMKSPAELLFGNC